MTQLKSCENCGKSYAYVRSTSRFCSTECRVGWHREQAMLERERQQKKQYIYSLFAEIDEAIDEALNEIEALDNSEIELAKGARAETVFLMEKLAKLDHTHRQSYVLNWSKERAVYLCQPSLEKVTS